MTASLQESSKDVTKMNAIASEIKALAPHVHPPVPNPAPLGLFAFGLTTALLQVKHTRIGGSSPTDLEGTDNMTFGFALFFGGLLQIIAGISEIKRNNVFGFTAFCVYGGFWMSVAATNFALILSEESVNPAALQAMLALMGIFTFVMMVCSFVLNVTITLLFFLLMMTFFLLAGGVDDVTVDKVAGWVGMATAATAYWLASAELVNDVIGGGKRVVIPLGHWSWNKFKFAGVVHVPGRIHGVRNVEQQTSGGMMDVERGRGVVPVDSSRGAEA